MGNLAGEAENVGLKLDFDGHLRLEFRGARVTTDAGLLAARELDGVLGLTEIGLIGIPGARKPGGLRLRRTSLLSVLPSPFLLKKGSMPSPGPGYRA